MSDFETFEHAGLTVRIYMEEFDQELANPRDVSSLGVMFCDYKGYSLGDDDAPDPREQTVVCDRCDGSGDDPTGLAIVAKDVFTREIVAVDFPSIAAAERHIERHAPEGERWSAEPQSCPKCEGEGEIQLSIIDYLKQEHGARVILPLMVYEHSGITMRVGQGWTSRGQFPGDDAGWDTSLVGVIFDTEQTRREGWGEQELTDEKIEEILRSEVYYYAAYLEGMVFGYDVLDAHEDGEGELVATSTGEVLDGLDDAEALDGVGMYLEPEIHKDDCYVKVEARQAAEACAEQIVAERREAFEWACRDVVTV